MSCLKPLSGWDLVCPGFAWVWYTLSQLLWVLVCNRRYCPLVVVLLLFLSYAVSVPSAGTFPSLGRGGTVYMSAFLMGLLPISASYQSLPRAHHTQKSLCAFALYLPFSRRRYLPWKQGYGPCGSARHPSPAPGHLHWERLVHKGSKVGCLEISSSHECHCFLLSLQPFCSLVSLLSLVPRPGWKWNVWQKAQATWYEWGLQRQPQLQSCASWFSSGMTLFGSGPIRKSFISVWEKKISPILQEPVSTYPENLLVHKVKVKVRVFKSQSPWNQRSKLMWSKVVCRR